MHSIKLLDQATINKIAAGEVVEGPRSVIKELVENSIDAGATAVTIEVRDGGTSYIRITDNGAGIKSQEATTAFLRHATSKITAIEDLEQAQTLGFRGEALASIAAVAQVEMTTRHKDEEVGVKLAISAGIMEENGGNGVTPVACSQGTTIIVKNLFFNVPARKKFLKKPAAESGRISDAINRLALGNPHIAFQYINNGTTILHTSGNNDPKAAVLYVYGKDAASKMIPVNYAKGDFSLTGLIGKPELTRANRNYENLFINGRYIKDNLISSAIEDAYKTRLMAGKFPVYVLHFQLPPDFVDANVHPAKLEVRFRNDNEVFQFFYDAITKAFDGQVLIPKVAWEKDQKTPPETIQPEKIQTEKIQTEKEQDGSSNGSLLHQPKSVQELLYGKAISKDVQEPKVNYHTSEPRDENKNQLPKNAYQEPKPVIYKTKKTVSQETEDLLEQETIEKQTEKEQKNEKNVHSFFNHYKIVGQLFQTYWIVEQGKSMYIIDQHAAHERVLYEEMLARLKEENVASQQLLHPVLLHLSESEKTMLVENQDLFEKFGFSLEAFPDNTYALKSVPYVFKGPVTAGFFTEILDILSIEGNVEALFDVKTNAIATMACKAAVKGHDKLDIQEAHGLINQLLKLENPFQCPHGRPTIIEMPLYELEKKFKRIQD